MTEDSDKHLFASAMKGVTPLVKASGGEAASESKRSKPKPIPRTSQTRASELDIELLALDDHDTEIQAVDELRFARHGVQPSVLRKLRRGEIPIQDQIDLHGMNLQEARQYVNDFLDYSISQGHRAVRIVHGKGRHSQQGPILKRNVGAWLRHRNEVLAYISARQVDGGTGALYVLLTR